MWAVESSHVLVHHKPDAGASAFFYDAAASLEQAFNIPPGNRRADRIGENRHKGLALVVVHGVMVLLFG